MSAAVQGFPFWRGLLLREYREHRALFLYLPLASLLLALFLLWRLSLLAFEEGGQLQGALSLLDGSEVLTLLPLFSTPHIHYILPSCSSAPVSIPLTASHGSVGIKAFCFGSPCQFPMVKL